MSERDTHGIQVAGAARRRAPSSCSPRAAPRVSPAENGNPQASLSRDTEEEEEAARMEGAEDQKPEAAVANDTEVTEARNTAVAVGRDPDRAAEI